MRFVDAVAAVMGGALYGLPFVDPALAPLALVGFAPALVVLARGETAAPPLRTALLCVSTGVALVGLPLVRMSWLALLIVGGFFILPWALAGVLSFAWLRRRTGWPVTLLWPCCWVVAEWGWSFHSVGSLAFGLSGYTLFRYPVLIQIADFAGVLGVGVLCQIVVGAVADLALAWLDAPGRRALRRALGSLLTAATVVMLAAAYGAVRLTLARPLAGPKLALVQPAIPHQADPAHMRLVQARQVGLARAQVTPGEVDLIVFPENAVIEMIDQAPYLHEFRDLSAERQTPLLVGVATHTDANADRIRRGLPAVPTRIGNRTFLPGYNSAALITAAGIVAKYDKQHMMTFTEQVPGERLFEWIGQLDRYQAFVAGRLGYIGTGVPGKSTRLLNVPGTAYPPYWTPVCFEQADARLSREASLLGARSFINITSEGDLGPQIYWSTAAVAVLRAVELHVGIARCGNMGITGIIDPWGRQTHHLRGKRGSLWGEPGVLKARLPLGPASPTVYARLGDWPAGAGAAVLAIAAAVSFRRQRKVGT